MRRILFLCVLFIFMSLLAQDKTQVVSTAVIRNDSTGKYVERIIKVRDADGSIYRIGIRDSTLTKTQITQKVVLSIKAIRASDDSLRQQRLLNISRQPKIRETIDTTKSYLEVK